MGGYGKLWRHLEAPECSDVWEALGGCGRLWKALEALGGPGMLRDILGALELLESLEFHRV